MDHRPSRNPWRLSSLLLLASAVLVLSCAVHGAAGCSTSTSMAIGTNKDDAQQPADSGNGGGDCHGRTHTHTHGHHGGGSDGKDNCKDNAKDNRKDKPGTTPTTASTSDNPWDLLAGAAPRGAQPVSGFTAATGVIILIASAAVSWLLATY